MSSKNTRNQNAGGGADWSTFPATQDVEMSNYDLSNVGGINNSTTATIGYVLTVSTGNSLAWAAAGGGTAAAWSTFPATQNVDMDNFSLIDLSNVSLQKINGASYPQTLGSAGQVLTVSSTANTLYWNTAGGGDISNWATCNAVQNVNISGYVISNISAGFISNNLTVSGLTTLSGATVRNALNVSGVSTLSSAVIQNALSVSGLTTLSGATIQNVLTVGGNISGITEFNGVDVKFGVANTLIGIGEGAAVGNTGIALTAIGSNAGSYNTGSNTIVFGLNAGVSNVSSEVISIGTNAGFNNSGGFGVQIGYDAGRSNTGSSVVAIGRAAGFNNTGNEAVGLGYNALLRNVGLACVGIGKDAGKENSGVQVNLIGVQAGLLNTGGNVNAIGSFAAYNNTGTGLNAFGFSAGNGNSGSYLQAFGYEAGLNNRADNCCLMGQRAGATASSGGFGSVAIGFEAGYGNDGSNSIFIGFNPSRAVVNTSANQFIVYSSNVSNNFLRGRLDCNFLGINCNSPQYNLDVSGSGNISGNLTIRGKLDLSGSTGITALVNNSYVPVASVLTLSTDNTTLFYRRPPMVTGGSNPAPTPGSTLTYGICGDLYIQSNLPGGGYVLTII